MTAVTLREAVAAGLFVSIDAARKASQRPGFPAVAGRRNNSSLYVISDLHAYRAGYRPERGDEVTEMPEVMSTVQAEAPETWKSMAALRFSSYEASDKGRIRSLDRKVGDRQLKGKVLAARVSNRGYLLVNLTADDGAQVTRSVHSLILTTFDGPCPRGQEARHFNDDPLDNRWAPGDDDDDRRAAGGNLAWGTPKQNAADKVRNGNRAAPAPPKACVRCQRPFKGNGRRCHECVAAIGQSAAELLQQGLSLGEACEALDYPSADGLHTLAVKYGGYGVQPERERSWLHHVIATIRDWLELGDPE